MDYNELAKAAYENAKAKGFYDKPVSIPERMALIHSELSEALEADRRNLYCQSFNSTTNLVNHIRTNAEFKKAYVGNIKGTFEEEMADVVIRILDLAGYEGEHLKDPGSAMPLTWRRANTTPEKLAVLHAHVAKATMAHYGERGFKFWPQLKFVLRGCRLLCEKKGIDLEAHVEAKMRYNSLRPKMHGGKKY